MPSNADALANAVRTYRAALYETLRLGLLTEGTDRPGTPWSSFVDALNASDAAQMVVAFCAAEEVLGAGWYGKLSRDVAQDIALGLALNAGAPNAE